MVRYTTTGMLCSACLSSTGSFVSGITAELADEHDGFAHNVFLVRPM